MPAFLVDWSNLKSFHILKSFISYTISLSPFTDLLNAMYRGWDFEVLKMFIYKRFKSILPQKFTNTKYSYSEVQMQMDKKKSLRYL